MNHNRFKVGSGNLVAVEKRRIISIYQRRAAVSGHAFAEYCRTLLFAYLAAYADKPVFADKIIVFAAVDYSAAAYICDFVGSFVKVGGNMR